MLGVRPLLTVAFRHGAGACPPSCAPPTSQLAGWVPPNAAYCFLPAHLPTNRLARPTACLYASLPLTTQHIPVLIPPRLSSRATASFSAPHFH